MYIQNIVLYLYYNFKTSRVKQLKLYSMEATIQNILKDKGYPFKDNRSMDFRNINKAIGNGVNITVCDKGYVYTGKDGFMYNIRITHKGWGLSRLYHHDGLHRLDATCVGSVLIHCLAKFRNTAFEKGLVSNDSGRDVCGKCSGKGKLPMFMHYAEGICFDCMGFGYVDRRKLTV